MSSLPNSDSARNSLQILGVHVAYFPEMRGTSAPVTRTLDEILREIKLGAYKQQIVRLRAILEKDGKDSYNKAKENLPSLFVSGTATDRKTMTSHSGIIQIDLDDCYDRMQDIWPVLQNCEHVAAIFLSPSGLGLKALFCVQKVTNKEEHKAAVKMAADYVFRMVGDRPDPSCKNWNRHCLVSDDPDLFRNPTATPFSWRDARKEERERSSSEFCVLGSGCSSTPLCSGSESELSKPLCSGEGDKSEQELLIEREERVYAMLDREEDGREGKFARMWLRYVWQRWTPEPGMRNQWIAECVPFLCCVGGRDFVLKCSKLFHQAAAIFEADLNEHITKTVAMIANVQATMIDQLSPLERRIYLLLDERRREAFLILRDCSVRHEGQPFPMSCKELRIRLCLPDNPAADRVLKALVRVRILEPVEPGHAYQKGMRPQATTYKWLLPMGQNNGGGGG